jgi:hypothetical protein
MLSVSTHLPAEARPIFPKLHALLPSIPTVPCGSDRNRPSAGGGRFGDVGVMQNESAQRQDGRDREPVGRSGDVHSVGDDRAHDGARCTSVGRLRCQHRSSQTGTGVPGQTRNELLSEVRRPEVQPGTWRRLPAYLVAAPGDFERIAAGTYQNWRDVADLSMEFIARDPDVTVPTSRGTTCHSRVIFLINLRTNQVVHEQIVRMVVVPSTGNIVTAYPTNRHCRAGDPSA